MADHAESAPVSKTPPTESETPLPAETKSTPTDSEAQVTKEYTDDTQESASGQVTLENYKVLLEILIEVKTEWYSLGTALDLDTETLNDIKCTSRVKYTEYLKELFRLWMEKGEEEATWEKLREALTNCYQKKLAASTEGKTGPVDMELSELTTLLMNAISVWWSLARELGVDRNLDKDINCHYSMHTMILKWIRINKKKATVDAIVTALENSDIESSSLVEKIRSDPEVQTTYLIIPRMAAL